MPIRVTSSPRPNSMSSFFRTSLILWGFFFGTFVHFNNHKLLVPCVLGQNISVENGSAALTADVLISSLFAKTPAEKDYCVFVVAKRDEKVLPNKILYGAYRYAVNKERDRRFTYFKLSLEKLCKDKKIVLNAPTVSVSRSTANPFSFLTNIFSFPKYK